MSVTYTGDTEWAVANYPSIGVDAWGFDVVTQRYMGRSDKNETFRAQWTHDRSIRHSTYSYATFDKISITPGPIFSEAEVTYRGIVGSDLPSPVIKGGLRQQSVTVEYTASVIGGSTGISATFEYYAPFKRVTWFTYAKLANLSQRIGTSKAFDIGPTYADMLKSLLVKGCTGAQGVLKIKEQSQVPVRGFPTGFPQFNSIGNLGNFGITTSTYTVIAQLIESDYQYEQVGSEIIAESSTVELKLIEANMGNRIPTT